GSSDVNDLKVSGTPRKRSLDGGFDTEATAAARNKDVVASSPIIRNGTPVSPLPGVMGPIHTGISTELSSKDEREVKREKRKQSNRESARRSRLRKQQYPILEKGRQYLETWTRSRIEFSPIYDLQTILCILVQ
uniref:BZIP domain-containing protein n=1 Tax=Aegilops tauschii subsp. strangulata TaxID=200361 RepID=A0A452ZYQ7_AEGTS